MMQAGLQRKRFIKRTEDFSCEVCGEKVKGSGYTDHCPKCLRSVHVDVWPGDRASGCGGLMEPVGVEQRRGRWRIVYRCQRCGERKTVGVAREDDFEKVLRLASGPLEV